MVTVDSAGEAAVQQQEPTPSASWAPSDFEDTMPVPIESGRPRHAGPPTHRGGPLPTEPAYHEADVDEAQWPRPPEERQVSAEPDGPGERGVPPWLFGVSVLALVAIVMVLGFVIPGFFVTKVFDQVAVQNGVRSVLVNDYRVQNVAEVVCPADQRVLAGRDFTCLARINNSPAQVRVVIKDSTGRYQVSRPN
jgi:uncharacterized protein DUF4333